MLYLLREVLAVNLRGCAEGASSLMPIEFLKDLEDERLLCSDHVG